MWEWNNGTSFSYNNNTRRYDSWRIWTTLTDNGLTYEDSPHKKERMEADLLKYKGQTVKVGHGNDKVVTTYTHNTGSKKKKKTDKQWFQSWQKLIKK